MQVVVQYVALPYVSLTRRSPFSIERIENRGAVRRHGYSIPYVSLHGITTAQWIYVLLRTRDRLAYAGRGTVRSYTLRVIGTQIPELSVLRIEPLRMQR
jgi:hypothetical protein